LITVTEELSHAPLGSACQVRSGGGKAAGVTKKDVFP
jgi:hypothetical protein